MKKLLFSLLFLTQTAFASMNLSDLVLQDLNKNPHPLSQYQGQNLYIKAWASWCPICLATLPDADELTAEKNKNFKVITVVSPSIRGEKEKEDFIRWYKGLEYKNVIVLLDESGELIKRSRVRGYPSSIMVDKNLDIQKTIPGHLDQDKIKAYF